MKIDLKFEEQDALIDAILFYNAYCENKTKELKKVGSYGAAIRFEKQKQILGDVACKISFSK